MLAPEDDTRPSEELRHFIDANLFVSARWFAVTLKISVQESKRVMKNFRENNGDVAATYCVSGYEDGSNRAFVVVAEDDLEERKKSFHVVEDISIYSIQKRCFTNTNSLSNQLYALDAQQTTSLLSHIITDESLLLNKVGGVKLNSIDVRHIGQRPLSLKAVSNSVQIPSKSALKTSVVSELTKIPPSSSSVPTIAHNFFSKASTTSKPVVTAAVDAKPVNSFQSFSHENDVDSTNNRPKKPEELPLRASVGKKDTNHSADAEAERRKDDEDNECEWDDGSGHSYKSTKKNITGTTESIREENDGDETSHGADEKKEKIHDVMKHSSPPRKARPQVRGAMDDFIEDAAIERFKAGERAAAAVENDIDGSAPQPSKKKRKLVEKMFADSKGYLVTEMVWEEVSDDEPEKVHSSAPVPAAGAHDSEEKSKKQSAAVNIAKKTKKGGGGATQNQSGAQKSMTSFFTKK